jgi:hypothetical protein
LAVAKRAAQTSSFVITGPFMINEAFGVLLVVVLMVLFVGFGFANDKNTFSV